VKICPACSREYASEHTHCRDDGVGLVHLDTGTSERAQDLIGQVVDGRYRVERIVGRGGMGTVYACRHVVVGKAFAMKVLRPGIERSEEILQRFIREAQAANAVQSRHICEMTDFGQLPAGAFYVVMELLHGMSLTRALREKKLNRRDIKHVFVQIAETLEKAHRANIVHRDLKPDNVVLVHDDGDPHFVKLVDFGIAKMLEHKASNLTETGVILGTPYYMSPEQARGDPVDHRSDIYALGVMMYRAFTGRLPFVADTAMGVLTRHLTEKPELPSRIAEMDGGLERLILRCLEKKPIDRFQSMADVAEALRAVADRAANRQAHAHPTIDERSAPLKAASSGDHGASTSSDHAPMSAPTPTRVATPHARGASGRAQAGHGGISVAPATRPEGAGVRKSGSIPPPLPSPAAPQQQTAQPHGGHAAHYPYGNAEGQSSGQHPLPATPHGGGYPPAPRYASETGGELGAHPYASGHSAPLSLGPGYDPLQGEAATNRGLVSSRLASVQPERAAARRAAWAAGAAGVALCIIAVTAVALYPSGAGDESGAHGAPPAEPTPTTAPEVEDDDSEVLDAPWASAEPVQQPHVDGSDDPDADPDAGASAASATPAPRGGTTLPSPTRQPQPQPEPEPEGPDPEIRSPFD
jgi:serine/threonine-protein kinase